MPSPNAPPPPPSTILIIGGGIFGLSTALSLLNRPLYTKSKITILDSSPQLPNPHGSSVDASRIIRADYANKAYAKLAIQAQKLWRDTSPSGWGGQERYHEPGFVLTVDSAEKEYVRKALETVKALASDPSTSGIDGDKIEELKDQTDIKRATGYDGVSGSSGYANWNSGWANAENCVAYTLRRIEAESQGRVSIKPGCVVQKILSDITSTGSGGMQCKGAILSTGEIIAADLTVLCAGAWSPTLYDLRGRCTATGQVLAYIPLSDTEQAEMENRPTIMNMSRGTFVIPPRNNELKVARHGFGYRNLKDWDISNYPTASSSSSKMTNGDQRIKISIPTSTQIPAEGQRICRAALHDILPAHMANRDFTRTRICWYCDTPAGDFLIDYPPEFRGSKSLFIATGGSGHGFKFLPVIGEKIVDAIEGRLEEELLELWRWKALEEEEKEGKEEFMAADDGSRAGPKGMILDEELNKL